MATRAPQPSPQVYARIGGALYLVIIVAGLAGELFVRGSIVVWGDAAATAANIARSEGLWRLGVAGDILMHVCDVPLMLIFYVLLEPVSRSAELSLCLWLLFKGVDKAKWEARAWQARARAAP
jgi:hypothetical protein